MIHLTAKPIHGAPRLLNTPEGMTLDPNGCGFYPGQKVTRTNSNGFKYNTVVVGFRPIPEGCDFRPKATVYLATDCYWFPVEPDTLQDGWQEGAHMCRQSENALKVYNRDTVAR